MYEAVPGICQSGMPIPTATCAAGRFISAIHSVTGCSTYISTNAKQNISTQIPMSMHKFKHYHKEHSASVSIFEQNTSISVINNWRNQSQKKKQSSYKREKN